MRTALVGNAGSRLHGVKTRCCNRATKPGEAVLWTLTRPAKNVSYTERLVILHVDCTRRLCDQAPEGAPVMTRRAVEAEVERIRRVNADLAKRSA